MLIRKDAIKLTLLTLMLAACSRERETPGGLAFTILKKGDGKELVAGQFLVLEMLVKDAKDSVWADTRKDGFPVTTQIQLPPVNRDKAKKEGLEAVFRMMTKGDSITFRIPAQEFFKTLWRQQVPKKVDAASYFTFFVTATHVMNEEAFRQFQQDIINRKNEKTRMESLEQLGKDTVLIDAYLLKKGWVAKKSPAGLRYIILKEGKGAVIQPAQIVEVNYKGYLLDGSVFDSNIESVAKETGMHREGRRYAPYPVQVGYSEVIQGWHEMLKLMSLGSKVTVFIPSSLGYGPSRMGSIQENSILVFDMEVVNLK